jgi:hypothetical protein
MPASRLRHCPRIKRPAPPSGAFFTAFSGPSRAPAVRVPGDFLCCVTIQDRTTRQGAVFRSGFTALTGLWKTSAFRGIVGYRGTWLRLAGLHHGRILDLRSEHLYESQYFSVGFHVLLECGMQVTP